MIIDITSEILLKELNKKSSRYYCLRGNYKHIMYDDSNHEVSCHGIDWYSIFSSNNKYEIPIKYLEEYQDYIVNSQEILFIPPDETYGNKGLTVFNTLLKKFNIKKWFVVKKNKLYFSTYLAVVLFLKQANKLSIHGNINDMNAEPSQPLYCFIPKTTGDLAKIKFYLQEYELIELNWY